MAKQAHLFLSKNIRHFRPINVIDFHNIHLCHLFGGRRLCMLCCSNIVLTFLTRILTKLPKYLDTAMVLGGQNSLKAIREKLKSHNGWKDSKFFERLADCSAWFSRKHCIESKLNILLFFPSVLAKSFLNETESHKWKVVRAVESGSTSRRKPKPNCNLLPI